jgi:hypothetical protein
MRGDVAGFSGVLIISILHCMVYPRDNAINAELHKNVSCHVVHPQIFVFTSE